MREPEKKRFDPSAEEGHAELEARLRRVQPAALPVELTRKLLAAHPASKPHRRRPVFQKSASHIFLPLLRWLMPAMAVLTVAAVVGRLTLVKTRVPGKLTTAAQEAPLKADDVQIDHELVSAFDAVAALPSGAPVRFRCRQWMDDVVLRDSARGLVVEKRTPRIEIVPVSYETY